MESYKDRLIVKGYTQQAKIDYNETFSLVVKMTNVKTLIHMIMMKGWDMYQLDVNNAFLHGDLHEEVYMATPQGLLMEEKSLVCRLNISLYGLKQASRQWYDKLAKVLYSRGYSHLDSDYSLFYEKTGASLIFVVIYVDDMILTGNVVNEISSLKNSLHDQFKIKDLGKLHYFLGLEILYKDIGVLISQRKFIMDLLNEFDCSSYTPVALPLEATVKLSANKGILLKDSTNYKKLVGKLNFSINT